MRLGLFGGTFDPVHFGHLLMAETSREHSRLDHVLFIPAGDPPHKPGRPLTPAVDRVAMLRLAVSGCPDFSVDTRELHRTGPTFTVDTLQEIARERPGDDLSFLMGADSLRDFLTWREPQRIAELANLIVCNRPGVASPSLEQITTWVGPAIAQRVCVVTMPGVDVSATELRARAADGRSLRFLTPRAVEVFIKERSLYHS